MATFVVLVGCYYGYTAAAVRSASGGRPRRRWSSTSSASTRSGCSAASCSGAATRGCRSADEHARRRPRRARRRAWSRSSSCSRRRHALPVNARFVDAGQLVKGGTVQVGGRVVGKIEASSSPTTALADVALDIKDDELTPLRRGTIARIRTVGLTGVANRFVELTPGPSTGDEDRRRRRAVHRRDARRSSTSTCSSTRSTRRAASACSASSGTAPRCSRAAPRTPTGARLPRPGADRGRASSPTSSCTTAPPSRA